MVVGPVKENGKRDKIAVFPLMWSHSQQMAAAELIVAAVNRLRDQPGLT